MRKIEVQSFLRINDSSNHDSFWKIWLILLYSKILESKWFGPNFGHKHGCPDWSGKVVGPIHIFSIKKIGPRARSPVADWRSGESWTMIQGQNYGSYRLLWLWNLCKTILNDNQSLFTAVITIFSIHVKNSGTFKSLRTRWIEPLTNLRSPLTIS